MLKKIKRNKKVLVKKRIFFFFGVFLIALAVPVFAYSLIFGFGKTYFVSPVPNSFQTILSKQAIKGVKTENIQTLLKKNNIPFESVEPASQSAILIRLKSGEDILFSTKKPYELQISSLQLILSELTIEGKRFLRLDFRFDKPVVVFK